MEKLIILPGVFIWEKGDRVIFYNPNSFKSLVLSAGHPGIKMILSALGDYDNLYEIELDTNNMEAEVRDFVNEIVSGGFGIISEKTTGIISLPPLLNIQSVKKKEYGESDEDVLLEYFTELTIYPFGTNEGYPDYYRQTYFPVTSGARLPNKEIVKFLENNRTPYLNNINLVIPCIDNEVYSLVEFLGSYGVNIVIHTTENDKERIGKLKKFISTYPTLSIQLVRLGNSEPEGFYSDPEKLSFSFLVRSEAELEKYMSDIEEYQLNDHSFIPIFDNNLKFFEDNVFLTEDDILNSKLTKRNIFINQSVNSNFFGALTILPDGGIYSNVNRPAIGTIDDNILEIISSEMKEDHSWRYIRNQKPCSDCLYQWLCPSPSNYEFVINKPNLCFVR